ncbi:cellobiose phosphorylase [Candidatus Margulisiibacteriota bacterium]
MSKAKYYISENNKFVIENYNSAPTFSSFFPGIAGIFGAPMWVFYANRGQCIASMGVEDKDGAIMEFLPANKAHRNVSITGFRTFIKVDGEYYEPFLQTAHNKNEMKISPENLVLIEENTDLKIKVTVKYFPLPNERFPAFTRELIIENQSKKARNIEVVDGLPVIVPSGFSDHLLKNISQTIEAWSIVENLENNAPFYKLKVKPADISETKYIEKGNFFLSFAKNGGKEVASKYIINPDIVFGETSSLCLPTQFIESKNFTVPEKQLGEGLTPSAMSFNKNKIKGGSTLEIYSILGQMDNVSLLNQAKEKMMNKAYIEMKAKDNKVQINNITSMIDTNSSSKSFDLYSKQTFLDNTMRGGLPVEIGNHIIYLYYRKHGDMERDYNSFKLIPSYFSQGRGNYRDINQNRRNDIFFNPLVKEDNIVRFFNLIQLDGFNPLVVLGSKFHIESNKTAEAIIKKHIKNHNDKHVQEILAPFTLGVFIKKIEEEGVIFNTSKEEFARNIMKNAIKIEEAEHGEGYWADHFFYNTDLLESFENIYPDKINDTLFNEKIFTFYDNDHIVLGRQNKYYRNNGRILQLESVVLDPAKQGLINSRMTDKNIMRADFGRGEIYHTTLLIKILCTIANKAASFDAEGIGIEMESDKPDWYDALNGLPALFGSSTSQTLELKRICQYILDHMKGDINQGMPVEIKWYIDAINKELEIFFNKGNSHKYWDSSYSAKEDFRMKTKLGISGNEANISNEYIKEFLVNVIRKCDTGIEKCKKKYNNYYTYFINEPSRINDETGVIKIEEFTQKPLPLFLEGFVHALKVNKDKNIFDLVRKSDLYDKKLKMYKVNASLKDMTIEIGRTKVFIPGWLENESIWLHMEYKFILELLKAGMHKEFFGELQNVLIPFIDPKIYKRSTFENSSFIASSVHPDEKQHGRGFIARLSGCAAEFIDMWIRMMCGHNIFFMDKAGKLNFKLSPVLPGWLFNKGEISFKLLGSIDATYKNEQMKDTFDNGVSVSSYKLILNDDKEVDINGPAIQQPYAEMIRNREVKKIIATLT